ncbi:uncharacterized protein LOC128724131 [Anopheles nili]|uniref:uncharacterized protein LOC128724131 n=1 Tax=Anopheles nili TaxID=185578 RepID=UPI00237B08FF|nr:uncharacterized protein LOC128724131 [Anopheles nili]
MVLLRASQLAIVLICIGAFALGEIHEVKQITAHKYKIEKVTDSSLRQALKSISHTNVKELDLSGNLLSVINAHDFAPLTNLEQLNLSSNVFSGSVDLQPLPKVRTIDLNNNFITDVLVGASVENLYAVNNNISRVDCQEAGESSNPKKFFLANNKLSSLLDLSAACRVRVETLDAKLNEIDTLNFGDLVGSSDTLRHLSLEDNFIFDVSNYPKVEFSRLDTLDLSSNKLAQMSVAFRAVAAAKSINLANNKFVLIGNITFSTSVTKFDLSGNGFQCETLKKFFEKNKHLQSYTMVSTRETCTGTTRHQGPYCCEDLSAPYADRLISLKQKEQSLYYGRGSEQNRVECERENQARQAKMKSIRNKYHVTVNEATYRERKKIMLNQEKAALEQKLPLVSGRVGEIESLVRESAEQLNLTTEGQNPLQLMRAIVQTFEDLHADEQTIQDQAIKDWEMHNQKDAPLSEENARLKKAVQGVDETLQSTNSTLLELSAKEQRLLKILKMDGQ